MFSVFAKDVLGIDIPIFEPERDDEGPFSATDYVKNRWLELADNT